MTINKGGRPKKEAYRKLIFRYSKVEDTFLPLVDKMQNEADKRLILDALARLRIGTNQQEQGD
ncbi:MAG: hypothetical protein H9W82_12130 [Lactobacillus sp.]|nr:hypothetical protein [Lactobacillus sp.]